MGIQSHPLVLQGEVPLFLGKVLLERAGAKQGHSRVQDRGRTNCPRQEGLADSLGTLSKVLLSPAAFTALVGF